MNRIPLITVLCAACGSGPSVVVAADYTLELLPITQDGQTPFDGDVELTVLVQTGDQIDRSQLGASVDATWQLPGQDHLEDSRIGLLLTDPSAGIDPIDLGDVRAWGKSPPITLSTGERELPVWVTSYGEVGQLGALESGQVSFVPASVMLSNGDVLVFGGSDKPTGSEIDPRTGPALRHVLRLRRTDTDLTFERVGDLPTDDGGPPGRVGATASVVAYEGSEAVLLAGGRAQWVPANNGTESMLLLDPDTLEVLWDGRLTAARSLHVAVTLADGRVMLLGGQDGSGLSGRLDFELFDPADTSVVDGGEVSGLFDVGFGYANLGDDGVLVCGGGAALSSPDVFELASGCAVLGLDGAVRPRGVIAGGAAGISGARMWHAMAPLGDGRVLVTGGVTSAPQSLQAAPATAEAWVFDPAATAQTWERVGDLNAARAMHAAIPLPDGRVLIIGGTTTGIGPGPVDLGADAGCPEVYDPDAKAFTALPCAAPAAGALPSIAHWPGYDAWVLEGFHTDEGSGLGGVAWGLAGLGPDFR